MRFPKVIVNHGVFVEYDKYKRMDSKGKDGNGDSAQMYPRHGGHAFRRECHLHESFGEQDPFAAGYHRA